ncbi:hypothetical protein XELAEV_18039922mg [Xenopus laevis]|uniref:Uncharacterized protein n=1 Tax=Xenopus laevis TaxID=8355 RepID=A0A974C8N2_XENLA|nr:hypothetical protein XELAEV_18039922mg [Xenopus laevis]
MNPSAESLLRCTASLTGDRECRQLAISVDLGPPSSEDVFIFAAIVPSYTRNGEFFCLMCKRQGNILHSTHTGHSFIPINYFSLIKSQHFP